MRWQLGSSNPNVIPAISNSIQTSCHIYWLSIKIQNAATAYALLMFIHLLCIRKAHFKYGMKERKVSKKQTQRRLEINCLKKNPKKEKLQNHSLTLGDLG